MRSVTLSAEILNCSGGASSDVTCLLESDVIFAWILSVWERNPPPQCYLPLGSAPTPATIADAALEDDLRGHLYLLVMLLFSFRTSFGGFVIHAVPSYWYWGEGFIVLVS